MAVPDLLLPEILDPLLRGTMFENQIRHFYTVGSTNSAAMSAASQGAAEGTVFFAEEQTAGRGRGAHSWESARSAGIYCSAILRPPLPPSEVLVLALAAGLAVRAAIVEIDPRIQPDLKWPNDVLIDGKKVCGILAEMNAEATRVRHIVVGIGLNVNHAGFPDELKHQATSLRMITGSPWSRVEVAAALLKSLEREYRALADGAEARELTIKRFSRHSSWVRGKPVRVEENGSVLEGTTDGLDERGFLLVRTARGVERILSGTVRGAAG
jgi:BirA family biotin operon repressor/biotin-[acetyl-CoA-carboxylase] ligase